MMLQEIAKFKVIKYADSLLTAWIARAMGGTSPPIEKTYLKTSDGLNFVTANGMNFIVKEG